MNLLLLGIVLGVLLVCLGLWLAYQRHQLRHRRPTVIEQVLAIGQLVDDGRAQMIETALQANVIRQQTEVAAQDDQLPDTQQ